MLKIKSKNNTTPSDGVKMDPVSLTIPDQSLTIQQILTNQQRGLPYPRNNPQYTGDLILPEGLDIADVMEQKNANLAHIKDLQTTIKEEVAQKEAKRKERSDAAKNDVNAESSKKESESEEKH